MKRLEQQSAHVISTLSRWPEQRLQFRPEPGAWSALEVLDHLAKVENSFVIQVRNNLPSPHAVTFQCRVRALMVNAVMRSPFRVKVPAGAEQVLPQSGGNLERITADWNEARRALSELVGQIPADRLNVGIFRHPVAGWMAIGKGIAFLSAHLRHHEYQLNRLERAARHL